MSHRVCQSLFGLRLFIIGLAVCSAGVAAAQSPSITTQPTPLTVLAGSTAEFTVVASGMAPLSYQWYKDSMSLGSTDSTLSLVGVTSDSEGSYSCYVSNMYGGLWSDAVSLTVTYPTPSNDECANAESIDLGVLVYGETRGATGSTVTDCSYNNTLDVWYSFTAASDIEILIDTWETESLDTSLAVYDGCGGTQLACHETSSCSDKAAIRMNVTSGNTYLIRVAGYNGTAGAFALLVSDLTLVDEGGGAVVFGDPVIKTAVRHKIGKYTGAIYPADLVNDAINSISVCGMGVTSLLGLEGCTYLGALDCRDNQITDLSPLSGLAFLHTLNVSDNSISDVAALSGVAALTTLDLASNQISSISALSELANLNELVLRGNAIPDISPLGGLTALTTLDVSSNPLSSIEVLASLATLQTLSLNSCGVTNLAPLSGMMNLNRLSATGNRIDSVSPLSPLSYLSVLDLGDNRVADVSMLSGLYSLSFVRLAGNPVTDLASFASNEGFGSSHTLDVTRAPLSTDALCTQIPAITGRGASVYFSGSCDGVDTDGDGLQDALESDLGTDYTKADSDLDGLSDYDEIVTYGTNAVDWDTDGDGATDGHEITDATDPLDELSTPVLTEVTFTDASLEAAIRNAISQPSGAIYEDVLSVLGSLNANYAGVADLSGIEHCVNLAHFECAYGSLVDLSPLSTLSHLTYLELRQNQIVDLSPLSDLTSLVYLYLGNNQIADASPLSGLSSLATLDLEYNTIANTSPFSSLLSLTALFLSYNQISDLSGLSGLASLTNLSLGSNQVTDVTLLSGLASLGTLMVDNNQITNIGPLSGLTSLTALYLSMNQVSDVSALSGMASLYTLDLGNNQIVDLSPLSGLTTLTTLSLSGNQIVSVSALTGLSSLASLYLGSNPIADPSVLSSLTSLSALELGNTHLVEIGWLSSLASLTVLDLQGNRIQDISALSELVLLSYLNVDMNRVSDLTPLTNLTSLSSVYLSRNPITDVSALVANAGVGTDDYVSLYATPLSQDALCTQVPVLTGRGANVSVTGYCGDTDTDGDGLSDAYEDAVYSNVNLADSDSDGLSDYEEILTYGTDPNAWDSDGDHASDVHEIAADTDPLDAASTPVLTEVSFPDVNLESTVRSAMNLASGPIYADEVARLTVLYAPSSSISNLSGMEYCTGLITVDLSGNEITDLSPLEALANLQQLYLSNNQIVDVSPLGALANLQELQLVNNQIVDVSGLGTLANLRYLYLANNQIVDVSGLGTLTNLLYLYLDNNQIVDVSGLGTLANLSELDLASNQIVDVSGLGTLASLQWLQLVNNQIVDVSGLSTLLNLGYLHLGSNQLVDLSGLDTLANLHSLFLSNNQLADLSGLASLTNLLIVDLQGNGLVDITALLDNTGFDYGDQITLTDNPLNLASLAAIDTLRARGTTVYYDDPAILSVDPSAGPVMGGFAVTITGQHFDEAGTTMVKVLRSSTEELAWATDVQVVSDGSYYSGDETTITCTFPAFTAGACDVVVINPNGVHGYLYDGFTYEDSAPVIVEQPVSTTAAVGGNGVFSVKAVGSAPLSYQWRKDGVNIADATDESCSVYVSEGALSPGGTYDCVVSNPFGSLESEAATLSVDATGYVIATLVASSGGHVTEYETVVAPGDYILSPGTVLEWSAVPDSTYGFVGWQDSEGITLTTNATYGLAVPSDIVLYPVFASVWYTLDIEIHGEGVVNTVPSNGPYAVGTQVSLSAVPSENWVFDHWVIAGAVTAENPTILTMTANRGVLAVFRGGGDLVFEDANLEQAVREYLGIPTAALYVSDVSSVEYFSANNRGIQSLEGMQAFLSLQSLGVSENSISSVSPLTGLTALTWLDVSNNALSTLPGELVNLSQLISLSLGNNALTDASIPVIAGLPNLQSLYLEGNPLHDLSPLSALGSLAELNISGTQIDETSPALNIPSLQALYCSNTLVQSLAFAANLTGLSMLAAENCALRDITGARNLTALTLLDLRYNDLMDITPLLGNEGLGDGDSVYLTGNPLNQASIAAIATLRANGVYVEYSDPVVTGVDPSHASVSGGAVLTITGERFDESGTTSVIFERPATDESAYATDVQVQPGGSSYYGDETTITCVAPAFTAGVCNVVVVNPGGAAAYLYDGFTFDGTSPVITQQPVSLTVSAGESASFSVTATGTAPLSYQWSKDGSPLSGATSAVLAISSVQAANTGAYVCTVSNAYGSAPSYSATLQLAATPQFQLTMARTGGGTTFPSLGAHLYDTGASVEVRAIPVHLWRFDHWEGDVANATANPTTVVMDTDQTVTAVFVRDKYALTVSMQGVGTVTPSVGEHLYDPDTAVTLTAAALPGSLFERWYGPVQDTTANSTQVVMDADKSVVAVFSTSVFLTLSKVGNGQVSPFEGTQAYAQNTEVSLEAVPDDGWRFVRWDGLVANALAAATTIELMYDSEATAIFTPEAESAEVTGVALDAQTGLPVPEAPVTLFDFASGTSLAQAETDESGRFTVTTPNLELVLSLHIQAAGYDDYDLPHFEAPAGLNVRLVPIVPAVPAGLVAIPGATQVLLRWEPNTEPDLQGYHVLRSDASTGPFTLVSDAVIPSLRYVDATVTPGHAYYYVVTAVDLQGNESDYSEPAMGRAGQIVAWMPDIDGDAGECIRIPINVANTAGIDPSELRIELAYDAEVLDPDSITVQRTGITADAIVGQDTSTPGTLIITTNEGSVLAGEGHIFDVYACIKPDVAVGTCGNLSFADVAFSDENGNPVPSDYTDAARVCVSGVCKMGDMDGNGVVEMADAVLVLRVAVKKIVPEGCQLTSGDMNGDELVDSADAVMIQRVAADRPLNPGTGDETVRGRVVRVYLLDAEVGPGGSVDVPINVDDPEGISGYDILVTFSAQPSELVLRSVDRGTATQDFNLAYDIGSGYVHISMSRDEAVSDSKASPETLAVLHFDVPETAPKNASLPVSLNAVQLKGQYGDDFTWYNSLEKSNGVISVNSLVCGAAAISVVNDADGKPIDTASVSLSPGPPFALTQNTSGIYVFTCVNSGTAQVRVAAAGFKNGSANITIQGGAVSTLELRLQVDPGKGGCCGGVLEEAGRTIPPKGGDPFPLMVAAGLLVVAAAVQRRRMRTQ